MIDSKLQKFYRLIPPDELYQIEGESKRTVLSQEDVENIIQYCEDNDLGMETMFDLIESVTNMKIGGIIAKRFLNGFLDAEPTNNPDVHNRFKWSPKDAE